MFAHELKSMWLIISTVIQKLKDSSWYAKRVVTAGKWYQDIDIFATED